MSGNGTFAGTGTLTAKLTSNGSPLAGETVTFTVATGTTTTPVGTAITDASGVATLSGVTMGSFNAGTYSGAVGASFAGDPANEGSSGSGILTVSPAITTTSLGSSFNPSLAGQSVTFTAAVAPVASGGGTPTGLVEFFDGTTGLGTETLDNTGTATFTTTALVAGSHAITVQYLGDSNFNGSASVALSQTVNQAGTTTAMIIDPPGSIVQGGVFGTVAEVEDASGNVVTGFGGSATISLLSGPGGTLNGTTTVPITNGQAVFDELSLSQLSNGTDYVFQITIPSVGEDSVTTSPLDVASA